MAKIFYGVSGEGMGHATRSQPIIENLKKNHAVHVFAGSRARSYLASQFTRVHRISSLHIHYSNNSVSDIGTSFWNLARAPLYAYSFLKVFVLVLYHNPDIIITDFEPFTSWLGAMLNKPIISVANIQFVTHTAHKVPKWHRVDAWKTAVVSNTITPTATKYIIPSIVGIPCRKNAVLANPPLRKGILSLKPSNGRHLLVYQTSKSNKKILDALQKSGITCIVYGFSRSGSAGCLVFKRFSEKEFYQDLASARAVITNGGFSLISEALYLQKPLLMMPVKKQYEQLANALEVENQGFGKVSPAIGRKELASFIEMLPKYRNALKSYRRYGNKALLSLIEEQISLLMS